MTTNGARVLLVDDIEVNRFLLREALEGEGWELREASSGNEAVEAYREWQPDAVILDLQMPDMDGYETSRRIRAIETGGRKAYVLLMSGNSDVASETAFAASGADEFLGKPYTLDDLRERIRDGLQRGSS